VKRSIAQAGWTRLSSLAEVSPISVQPSLVNSDDTEQFLAVLASVRGSCGDQALRSQLGWEEATYREVREALVAHARVEPGRVRGGSVKTVPSN
jgi:hypothetical protein